MPGDEIAQAGPYEQESPSGDPEGIAPEKRMRNLMTAAPESELVLIIDDDPITTELVSAHLSAAGYHPLVAENGLQALGIISHRQPRIVISDWLMPKMDGLELCRELRKLQAEGMTYFIMLTVQSDKERLLEAFDVGVDDFLSKPFHEGELLARVRAGSRMVRMCDELAHRAQALVRSNSELCRLNEKLRHAATTDDLTKLLNRRQAMARVREHWALSDRYGQPLSCAMVDIDHFKQVNDRFGHLRGDVVLQRIAGILVESVRASDTVFRMGGEEFLILFPHQTADEAAISAERCCLKVREVVRAQDGESEPVTISVGVAQRLASMQDPDDLLKAADEALYAAKREGRDRVLLSAAAAA
jgi:two-component system, cell cycle response regulator